MSCPPRLVLFVDDQNFYGAARRAFFPNSTSHVDGQFNPVQLGELICSRPADGITKALHQIRVYTGRPRGNIQPKGHAANRRQCAAWEKWGAEVSTRPLRYLPGGKPEQKGIDVALATDFVTLAIDGEYDVGVIASADTDLRPALEFVLTRYQGKRQIEVVAWKGPNKQIRLSIPKVAIPCHWLTKDDYDQVADLTDYTVP